MPNRIFHLNISEHAQTVSANAATAISGGGAVTSMMAANEVIQIIAGCVAIVAGIAAAWWHFERIYDARRKRRDDNRN